MVERGEPIDEVSVAAETGRPVFDKIARKYHTSVRNYCNHVTGGMAPSNMHDPYFPSAQPHRDLIRECRCRPSQTGDCFSRAEKAREAGDLEVNVLLAALGENSPGSVRCEDLRPFEC